MSRFALCLGCVLSLALWNLTGAERARISHELTSVAAGPSGVFATAAPPRDLGRALQPGEPVSFQYPSVDVPTLFAGANGLEIMVPAGARRLEISVVTTTSGANLDLFVNHGAPPTIVNGQVVADFSSTGYSGYESITVSAESNPSLQAGTYSIALVVRTTGTAISGRITATYSMTDSYSGVTLQPGTPSSFSLPAVANATLFRGMFLYRIDVPQGATRLEVSANAAMPSAAADVDLHVRRGMPPEVSGGQVVADHSSESPDGIENLVVTPSSQPPLTAGTYYVALVLFTTNTPVEGIVTAILESGGTPPPAADPALAVSSNSLSFRTTQGSNPEAQSFTVRNSGGGTLSYTLRDDAMWLVASPTSGTSSGEADTIAVSVDTTGLTAGAHTGTITVDGAAAGSAMITVTLIIEAAPPPGGNAPLIGDGGVVNAADFTAVFAPGGMISIFGQNLAPGTAVATDIPLPLELQGVSVEVADGERQSRAPLFFVSAGQINAQLPFKLSGPQVQIRIRGNGGVSNAETISITPVAPRLFTTTSDGAGEVIVVHNADWEIVSQGYPASTGEVLNLFLTGLGAVSPAVEAGQAGGDDGQYGALNWVVADVSITMADVPVTEVYFSGLAPGFVGLYQLSFKVPAEVPRGPATVKVSAGGMQSQTGVYVICGRDWVEVSSATVDAGGGTVNGGGMSLSIPAGALPSSETIRVFTTTSGTEMEGNRISEIYGLGGLPDTTAQPMTVTLPVNNGAPISGTTYVVVTELEEGGGQMIVEAKVEGGQITATLPPRQGRPAVTPGTMDTGKRPPQRSAGAEASGQRETSFDELAQVFVYAASGFREHKTAHFDIKYPVQAAVEDPMTPLGEGLERAYTMLEGLAVNLSRVKEWPVEVWLVEFEHDPEDIWKNYDEPWGELRRSFWVGKDIIRLNASTMRNFEEIQEMTRKAVHQLVHVVSRAYVSARVSTTDITAWLWLDEAMATWFERRFAGGGAYIPWQVHGSDQFMLWRGLEFQYTDYFYRIARKRQELEMRFHGYGAFMFLEHMASRLGDPAWFSAILTGRASVVDETRQPMPLEVLEQTIPDLGERWFEYTKDYVESKILDGVEFPDPNRIIDAAEWNEGAFDDKDDKRVFFEWQAPDIGARLYGVKIHHKYPEGTKMAVEVRGLGSHAIVHRVASNNRFAGWVGEVSEGMTVQIENPREMFQNGQWLLIMVVATATEKPYNGARPIVLEVSIVDDKGPIRLALDRAAEANKLTISTAVNAHRKTCVTPDGGSATCGNLDISSAQHIGEGQFQYADTTTFEYGEKIRASAREPIPPYCNESYMVSIEVALSEDGRTVQSLEGDWECGFRGTAWDGTEFTERTDITFEIRDIPLDEDFTCSGGKTCYHYDVWGAVKEHLVKYSYKKYRNGTLTVELKDVEFRENSATSSIVVHFEIRE